MKKLLPLAAALTFTLTACTAPTSDTLPAAPEESTTTQDVGSGEVRMLSAADGGIYYQTFADSEVNHEVDIGRNLVYAVEETTGLARRPAMCPAAPTTVMPAQPTSKARPLVMPMAARSISTSAYIKKRKIQPFSA